MRKKFALLVAVAAVAALALVPSSQAASSSIKVTTSYDFANLCRAAVDQIGFQFEFSAKIKRRNSPLPKSVLVKYKVLDASTGSQYASGRVTLTKRNKWRKLSNRVVIPAGSIVVYDLVSTYRAPRSGRLIKATSRYTDTSVPTVEQLDAATNPLPPCAVG